MTAQPLNVCVVRVDAQLDAEIHGASEVNRCAIWPSRRSGAAIRTLALTYVEMALVRADRLTATERAMASTVRGRPGRTHGGFS